MLLRVNMNPLALTAGYTHAICIALPHLHAHKHTHRHARSRGLKRVACLLRQRCAEYFSLHTQSRLLCCPMRAMLDACYCICAASKSGLSSAVWHHSLLLTWRASALRRTASHRRQKRSLQPHKWYTNDSREEVLSQDKTRNNKEWSI